MSDDKSSEAKLKQARILVVEDDADYAAWLEVALSELGVAHVSWATDGEEALRITRSESKFDLILCDWMMPNMDGLDFLKRYREEVPTSLFLVLTAKTGLEDAFEVTQAGATNFLVKPISAEELQDQITSMVR